MIQNKKTLSWANFLEAVIVAPIFVAWVNLKNIYDTDIFIENRAIFANTFLKYKILVMDYAGSCNECTVFCNQGLLKLTTHGKHWNVHI